MEKKTKVRVHTKCMGVASSLHQTRNLFLITKGSLNYQGLNTGQTDLIRRDFTQDKQTYLLVRNRQELLLTVLALNRTLNLQDKFSVLVFC